MTFFAGEDWTAADANGLDTRITDLENRSTGVVRYNSTAQSLPNGSTVTVTWPSQVTATPNISYSAGIFTVNLDCTLTIESSVRITGAGPLEINLWVSTDGGATYRRKSGFKGSIMGSVSATYPFLNGNTFKVTALQTSGGAATIETLAEETTHISAYRQ